MDFLVGALLVLIFGSVIISAVWLVFTILTLLLTLVTFVLPFFMWAAMYGIGIVVGLVTLGLIARAI